MSATRRQFLQAAGLAGAAALASDVLGKRAKAEEGPQRLLIVLTPNGTMHDLWRMAPNGQPEQVPGGADWEANLAQLPQEKWSPLLAPLFPMRQRLSVFESLSLFTAAASTGNAGIHSFGQASLLAGRQAMVTGSHQIADAVPAGPTLDQLVADRISRPDRLHSLQLRIGFELANFSGRDAGDVIPYLDDPLRLYALLFPAHATPGPFGASLDKARPKVRALVEERFQRALRMSGKEDRDRLGAHRDLLADTDRRMQALLNASCPAPPVPTVPEGGYTPAVLSEPNWDPPRAYTACYEGMRDLLLAAFACDLVRVAVLDIGEMPAPLFGAPMNQEVHFGLAHFADDFSQVEKRAYMKQYHLTHGRRLADLLARLDAVPDAGGGTLLDNTLVVWTSEVGSGSHRFWPLNAWVAGGRNHRAGRYRKFNPRLPRPATLNTDRPDLAGVKLFGPAHNQLLAGIANTFGLGLGGFGQQKVTGVPGVDGTLDVDLSGALSLG